MLNFVLTPSASGGCTLYGCSESQVTSYYDYSTNYCNLKDLYCNSADGCQIANSDLEYDEVIEECSYTYLGISQPQHDFSQCLVYVAPTPVATELASPTASPVALPTAWPAPLSTSPPSPPPTPYRRPSRSRKRAGVVGVAISVILVLIAVMYPLVGLILRLRGPLPPSRGLAFSQLRTREFELAPVP